MGLVQKIVQSHDGKRRERLSSSANGHECIGSILFIRKAVQRARSRYAFPLAGPRSASSRIRICICSACHIPSPVQKRKAVQDSGVHVCYPMERSNIQQESRSVGLEPKRGFVIDKPHTWISLILPPSHHIRKQCLPCVRCRFNHLAPLARISVIMDDYLGG